MLFIELATNIIKKCHFSSTDNLTISIEIIGKWNLNN